MLDIDWSDLCVVTYCEAEVNFANAEIFIHHSVWPSWLFFLFKPMILVCHGDGWFQIKKKKKSVNLNFSVRYARCLILVNGTSSLVRFFFFFFFFQLVKLFEVAIIFNIFKCSCFKGFFSIHLTNCPEWQTYKGKESKSVWCCLLFASFQFYLLLVFGPKFVLGPFVASPPQLQLLF